MHKLSVEQKHIFDLHVPYQMISGGILLFFLCLFLFPAATYEGASSGLLLWFHNVLPNLLPFIILSDLLVCLNITRKISYFLYPLFGRLFRISMEGCYPIAIGFLSGLPMGAKATADLVLKQKITRKEGNFLLSMCNNASPMFIIGYITMTQLKLPQIKYALFVIIYISSVLGAVFYRMLQTRNDPHSFRSLRKSNLPSSTEENVPVLFSFRHLDSSIMNGFEIITKIGGYIMLFSIMSQIIHSIGPDIGFFKAFLMGVLEITTGINQICKSDLNQSIKIVLVTVLTSFGGCSSIAQTKSVLGNSGLSIRSYLLVKLISAVIAGLLAIVFVILTIS